MVKIEDKIAELKTRLGDEELVTKILAGVVNRQKEAEKAGIAFKGKKIDPAVSLSKEAETFISKVTKEVLLETKKAEKDEEEDEEMMDEADEEMEDEGTGGNEEVPEEEEEEMPEEEDEEDEEDEEKEANLIGIKSMMDATPAQFLSIMTQALSDSISPYLAEVKQLREAVENSESTKELTETKELLGAIEKSVKVLNKRLKALEGDTPNAARGYVASEDDDNELTDEEKKEMKAKHLLSSEKEDSIHESGINEFMDFVIEG